MLYDEFNTGLEARKMENNDQVFQYYVNRSDMINALRILMSRVPPLENHSPCPTHIVELCSNIPHSTQYLTTCLRNELARYCTVVYVYSTWLVRGCCVGASPLTACTYSIVCGCCIGASPLTSCTVVCGCRVGASPLTFDCTVVCGCRVGRGQPF